MGERFERKAKIRHNRVHSLEATGTGMFGWKPGSNMQYFEGVSLGWPPPPLAIRPQEDQGQKASHGPRPSAPKALFIKPYNTRGKLPRILVSNAIAIAYSIENREIGPFFRSLSLACVAARYLRSPHAGEVVQSSAL